MREVESADASKFVAAPLLQALKSVLDSVIQLPSLDGSLALGGAASCVRM